MFLQSRAVQSSLGEVASCFHQSRPSALHAKPLLACPDCSLTPSARAGEMLLYPREGNEENPVCARSLVGGEASLVPFAFEFISRAPKKSMN